MMVGVPKEIKPGEGRVALTPLGVEKLTGKGVRVFIQKGAGALSGFTDEEYKKAGAEILLKGVEIFHKADLIVKVKEPLPQEYPYLRENQIIFTFFHFPSSRALTEAVRRSKCVAIAYENVEENGEYCLLAPMSMIAGRIAVLEGTRYLGEKSGGKGILLGGTGEKREGKVVIIGAGHVGRSAAILADNMGGKVTVMDIREEAFESLKDTLSPEARFILSTEENISKEIKNADLVIGAVYSRGRKAPVVVKREMVKNMQKGSVIVDVAIDQGGCIETSHPTSWNKPVFIEEGIIHFCVTNIPGAFPRTSTLALTRVTYPYVEKLAIEGTDALKSTPSLLHGLSIGWGKVFHPAISEAFSLPLTDYKI